MNRRLAFAVTTVAILAAVPAFSQSAERNVDLQFRRVDQRISRIEKQNEQIFQDMRQMQRTFEDLKKKQTSLDDKFAQITDDIARLRNTEIANLAATDVQLANKVEAINQLVEKETPVWNWGSQNRDCKDISVKHQQIQTVKSADGNYTLRYICFDGRSIHLGTEVNLPPKQ